jgi:hypothetical protein
VAIIVWLTPEEKAEAKRAKIYHVPLYEGDYIGFLKQPTLFEIFNKIGYAENEKKLLWELVGHGNAYADCGSIKAKGCDNIAHKNHDGKMFIRYYKRSCRRKKCPICYENWSTSEAERALIRFSTSIQGKREVDRLLIKAKRKFATKPRVIFHKKLVNKLESINRKIQRSKPIHVILSPPQDSIKDSISSYQDTKKTAYSLAKQHGLKGGSCVFHPYRLRCNSCSSAIPDYHKKCLKCGNTKFSWAWSPHFHFIGFGWIVHTQEGYEKHKWIIKNLGVRKSLFYTFQYLLSHAGASAVHTTTWFGSLSYNKLGYVPKLGAVPEKCPLCEKILRPMIAKRELDRPPPTELDPDPYLNEFLASPEDYQCL